VTHGHTKIKNSQTSKFLHRMSVNMRHFKVIHQCCYQVKSCCSHDSFTLVKHTTEWRLKKKIQCHSVEAEGRCQRDPRDHANIDNRNEANKPVMKAARQIIYLVRCKTQNYWRACQIRHVVLERLEKVSVTLPNIRKV